MGCTGSDTFIIQNAKLNKLFDANIVGSQGLIPFINFDGNALEVQSGFDFNSDTNTLRTGCVELGDGNSYCSSSDFPNPDLSGLVPYTGATGNVDFGIYNIDTNWVYANVVWADQNRGYGTMYCTDGNIVVGYLVGFTC